MRRNYTILILLISLLTLNACQEGGDAVAPAPPLQSSTTSLTGSATLGPVRNGVVTVYRFNTDGSRGEVLASSITDATGQYGLEKVKTGLWIVCVSGNADNTSVYEEEASGETVVLNETDEMCAVRSGSLSPQLVPITPLTHIGYGLTQYLIATGMDVYDAIEAVRNRLFDLFLLSIKNHSPSALTELVDLNDEPSNRYGAILASISQYAMFIDEQTQGSFNSQDYSATAYDDIRYDGFLNGQGEEGVLTFNGISITPDSYRHELVKRLFVFLDSDRNQSGMEANVFSVMSARWNDSNDAMFAGAPIIPLDTLVPIITNVSLNDGATLVGTVTLSADAADIYHLSSVVFNIDDTQLDSFATNDVFSYELDTSEYPDGSHTLSIVATNQFDGQSTENINVLFNNNQIVIANINPVDGSFLRGDFTISADVSDPQGISEVAFYLNNSFYTYASDVNNPSVMFPSSARPDGEHQFHLLATNNVGSELVSDTVTYTIDNTLPDVDFPNITNGDILQNTFDVVLDVSDNILLNTAELLLDGNPLATYSDFSLPLSPFALDTTLYDDGSVTLALTANDRAGNNEIITRNVTIDNNAPNVNITSPTNGSTLTDSFNIMATANDTIGVTSTEYYLNDELLVFPFADPANYNDGNHTITVKSYDAAANEGSDSVNVVFDTTPPSVTITNPLEGTYHSNDFTITADVSDAVGIDTVSYYMDTVLLANPNIVVADYTDGSHTIEARATDVSAFTTSAFVDVFIDNVPPSVTITNPLEGDVISGSFRLAANVSDTSGIQQVEFLIDDLHLSWASSFESPGQWFTSQSFTNGPHKFSVKVWDNAGRISQADVNVTINN